MARSPKTPARRRSKALVELFPHLGPAPEGPPEPNAAAETLKESSRAVEVRHPMRLLANFVDLHKS